MLRRESVRSTSRRQLNVGASRPRAKERGSDARQQPKLLPEGQWRQGIRRDRLRRKCPAASRTGLPRRHIFPRRSQRARGTAKAPLEKPHPVRVTPVCHRSTSVHASGCTKQALGCRPHGCAARRHGNECGGRSSPPWRATAPPLRLRLPLLCETRRAPQTHCRKNAFDQLSIKPGNHQSQIAAYSRCNRHSSYRAKRVYRP